MLKFKKKGNNMAYLVSTQCIETLKELNQSFNNKEEIKPLKNKKDVEELLMSLGLIVMAAQFKNDDRAKEQIKQINAAGEELKAHIDEFGFGLYK